MIFFYSITVSEVYNFSQQTEVNSTLSLRCVPELCVCRNCKVDTHLPVFQVLGNVYMCVDLQILLSLSMGCCHIFPYFYPVSAHRWVETVLIQSFASPASRPSPPKLRPVDTDTVPVKNIVSITDI